MNSVELLAVDSLFQQDNASIHDGRVTQQFL